MLGDSEAKRQQRWGLLPGGEMRRVPPPVGLGGKVFFPPNPPLSLLCSERKMR